MVVAITGLMLVAIDNSSTSSMAHTNWALALGGMHQLSFSQGLSWFFSVCCAPSQR